MEKKWKKCEKMEKGRKCGEKWKWVKKKEKDGKRWEQGENTGATKGGNKGEQQREGTKGSQRAAAWCAVLSAQDVGLCRQLSLVSVSCVFLWVGRCGVSLCVRRRTPPNPKG